jgi:hypothetical protein
MKTKVALMAIGVGLLIPVIVGAIIVSKSIYRFIHPYLDREIAGQTTISHQWLEITPEQPLRPERQVQYLYIHTAPFDPDYRAWGIRFPDGSVVTPEVQLVDQDGSLYSLKSSSFSLEDRTRSNIVSGIGFKADIPKDKVYRTVRIRSDKPITVSSIVWRCYDPRDRK